MSDEVRWAQHMQHLEEKQRLQERATKRLEIAALIAGHLDGTPSQVATRALDIAQELMHQNASRLSFTLEAAEGRKAA
jgi:hypothetical protein